MTHRVTFADIEDVDEREEWALLNCMSFSHRVTTDVSDVSLSVDLLYDFFFDDEKDAVWFKLAWS